MGLKRFETRAEASDWWQSWADSLIAKGECASWLDVVDLPMERMFADMLVDGYDPESAKQFL